MVRNLWRIDTASNAFLEGGFYEPALGVGEILVELPTEDMPDRRTERYDQAAPSKRRAATEAELAAQVGAEKDRDTDQALRGLLDHLTLALAEKLPSVVTVVPGYAPRQFAEAIRGRVIELRRAPNTRPK